MKQGCLRPLLLMLLLMSLPIHAAAPGDEAPAKPVSNGHDDEPYFMVSAIPMMDYALGYRHRLNPRLTLGLEWTSLPLDYKTERRVFDQRSRKSDTKSFEPVVRDLSPHGHQYAVQLDAQYFLDRHGFVKGGLFYGEANYAFEYSDYDLRSRYAFKEKLQRLAIMFAFGHEYIFRTKNLDIHLGFDWLRFDLAQPRYTTSRKESGPRSEQLSSFIDELDAEKNLRQATGLDKALRIRSAIQFGLAF